MTPQELQIWTAIATAGLGGICAFAGAALSVGRKIGIVTSKLESHDTSIAEIKQTLYNGAGGLKERFIILETEHEQIHGACTRPHKRTI